MKLYQMADPIRYPRMTTQELRDAFLVEDLFRPGAIAAVYIDLDRTIVGSAVPLKEPLRLGSYDELKSAYFTERRELGILNVGQAGSVTVGAERYELAPLSCLYVGRGNESVVFESADPEKPAEYYLLSYPAHGVHPTALVKHSDVQPVELGAAENCSKRRLHKYIYADGIKSCQLVMGFTQIETGNVWNSMPPHTHMRRSEVYLYFDLAAKERVVHLMGPANETRHLVVANKQVIISPGWSIHAGAGTASYKYCWGMGGENQEFTDMDAVAISGLQ
jgi:4-deoxy-L-threo-5-hexosulose-uronate ketol-isomerase